MNINRYQLRPARPQDLPALEQLYRAAFPEEDLIGVVRDLSMEGIAAISCAAWDADRIIGHVFFTGCTFEGTEGKPALLGPIAVEETYRRQGIGAALVQEGCRSLTADNVTEVFVLGDPALYGRYGFTPTPVATPYAIPDEWQPAWRSKTLGDASRAMSGTLLVPPAWQHEDLWSG